MGEGSDIPLRSAASNGRRNADGKSIRDPVLPVIPALFLQGEFTLLKNIWVCVPQVLSDYHFSEVPGSGEAL